MGGSGVQGELNGCGERGGARDCLRPGHVENSAAMRDVSFNCVLQREIMRDVSQLPASCWFHTGFRRVNVVEGPHLQHFFSVGHSTREATEHS